MEQWSWQLGWHESEASRVQGGYCQERWKQDIVAGAGSWGSNDNMISNPSLANGRPERSGTGMICPLRPFSTVYLIMHDFLIKSLLSKRLIKSEFHPPKKQGNCFSPGLAGSTSWSWDLAWEGSRFSTDSQSRVLVLFARGLSLLWPWKIWDRRRHSWCWYKLLSRSQDPVQCSVSYVEW